MQDEDLGIDDVRRHLCWEMAERLLTYRDEPEGLARLIWSSKLESELYNMEEKRLASLQEDVDRGLADEADVRSFFASVRASRNRNF